MRTMEHNFCESKYVSSNFRYQYGSYYFVEKSMIISVENSNVTSKVGDICNVRIE